MIVGFTGRIGSGKTTAAFALCEIGFKRHRFAGSLKSMLHCLGLTAEHTDGALKETPCAILGGNTPRFAMQTLGTEWGRDLISPFLWIDAWRATLPSGDVVCDDVRFENEANAIRELGGIVFRIERDGHDFVSHASEEIAFPVDETIWNWNDIAGFSASVRRIVGQHTAQVGVRSGQHFGNSDGKQPEEAAA